MQCCRLYKAWIGEPTHPKSTSSLRSRRTPRVLPRFAHSVGGQWPQNKSTPPTRSAYLTCKEYTSAAQGIFHIHKAVSIPTVTVMAVAAELHRYFLTPEETSLSDNDKSMPCVYSFVTLLYHLLVFFSIVLQHFFHSAYTNMGERAAICRQHLLF